MFFGNVDAAYLFLLMIGLLVFYFLAQKKREETVEAFAEKQLLAWLIPSRKSRKNRIKIIFLFMAMALFIAALMRPRMECQGREEKRSGLDMIVAIDTSRSMLAEDVKPNRLVHAKRAVRDFVKKLKGDRIGLMAFSGNAFLLCPLTVDYSAFLLSLEGLDVDTIPRGGTSVTGAIRQTLRDFGKGGTRGEILVLISDGENHEGSPVEAAEAAKKEGLKIFTIGIGTKEGDIIPIPAKDGGTTYLKDSQGRIVRSHLDEALLKKIAFISGGSYARANEAEAGLSWIYEETLSKLEKKEFEGRFTKDYREWYQIPLAIALVLLLLEPLLSSSPYSFPRRRTGKIDSRLSSLILLISFLFLVTCQQNGLREANRLYHHHKYEEASKIYGKLLSGSPDSSILNYDAGVVCYKKKDYEKAVEHFTKALLTEASDIEAMTNYNIGNCKYRQAEERLKTDLASAIERYREALDYYERAIELNGKDEDAKYNRTLVEKKLGDVLHELEKEKGKEPIPRRDGTDRRESKKEIESEGLIKPDQVEGQKGEMSRETAEALLEQYRLQEESRTLLTGRKRKGDDLSVAKDW